VGEDSPPSKKLYSFSLSSSMD